ncbi:hypothetical protein HY732_00525 [Candidatus Uhrbacteria bacterium]|nr:hypothetical protein [Candidatus Uhrbacteria bacterium]
MSSFLRVITIAVALLFVGQACSLQFSSKKETGLYKTITAGRSWKQKSSMRLADGRISRVEDIDVTKIVVDQRNPLRVFLGTTLHGLFASEDGGEEWVQLIAGQSILDIALDPTARCTLFFTTTTALLRTTNCAESWDILFRETRDGALLRSVAVDYSSPTTVYLASASGDLFKSFDGGLTWRTQYRNPAYPFAKIIIDRYDPNLLYLASAGGGIVRSVDRGEHWEDITGNLADFPDAHSFRTIESTTSRDALFYASDLGLYKTGDAGKTWQRIPLLTPAGSVPILIAGSNGNDSSEYFYGTRNTFYRTNDDGAHWVALPLPSGSVPAYLAIDPTNASIQYLGFRIDRRRLEPYWYYGPEQFY